MPHPFAGIAHGDRRIGHHIFLGIFHRHMEIACRGASLPKGKSGKQRKKQCDTESLQAPDHKSLPLNLLTRKRRQDQLQRLSAKMI